MKDWIAVLAFVALAFGCGANKLPNSDVEDTPEHRAIWKIVQAYRTAMENRDAEAIAKLVSRDYFENRSTTDKSKDDYGHDKLKQRVLPKLRDNIKKVQYWIYIHKIEIKGDRAHADYEFFWRFLFVEGGREGWAKKYDVNRLEFVREEVPCKKKKGQQCPREWKIVGGL